MTIPAIINVLIIKYFVIYFSHVIAYVLHRVLLNAFLSIEAHPNVSSLTITFIKSYEEAMSDKRAVVHYIVSATDCTNHVSDQLYDWHLRTIALKKWSFDEDDEWRHVK